MFRDNEKHLNERAAELDAQQQRLETWEENLLREQAQFETMRDKVLPVIGLAQQIEDEFHVYTNLTDLDNPDDVTAFTPEGKNKLEEIERLAVEKVRDRYVLPTRDRLVDERAWKLEEELKPKIEQEIRDNDGPEIEEKAVAKLKDRESDLRDEIHYKVAREIGDLKRDEFLALLTEQERQPIINERAQRELEKEQQETIRQSEAHAREQKDAEEKQAKVDQETVKTAEKARVADIAQDGSHGLFKLQKLKSGEKFTVGFVYKGEEDFSQDNIARIVKFETIDPVTGKVLILTDSWSKSKNLILCGFAFEDGKVVTLGYETHEEQESKIDHILRKGFRMLMQNTTGKEIMDGQLEKLDVGFVFLGDDEMYRSSVRSFTEKITTNNIFNWKRTYQQAYPHTFEG